ncbi:MAG TPA: putative quinol monooxygenase [Ilumatobacteraceae bacterium]|nr:putative quinol monooxygenase [Ilumatobacteraceae bacterium]
MANVAIIAKIPAKPGMRDQLIEALQVGIQNVQSEPGTLQYIMHKDANDPDLVWFYEFYDSQESFVHHGSTDGIKAMGMASREFAAGRPELIFLEPVAGKGTPGS